MPKLIIKEIPSKEGEKIGPPPKEPSWGKRDILINMRGSGMRDQRASVLHIDLPDGSVASRSQADALVVWPSARLRIVFGESQNWYRMAGTPWHKQATLAAMKLASSVKLTWMNNDVIGRVDLPMLKPVAYKKDAAAKLVARTLFTEGVGNRYHRGAWSLFRTGAALSVRYDASLLVRVDEAQLHLPPTRENVAMLESLLDELARTVPFAWAGVGYGLGGFASAHAMMNAGVQPRAIKGVKLGDLGQRDPDADWLVWIGPQLTGTPVREKLLAPLARGAGRKVALSKGLIRIAVERPKSLDVAKRNRPAVQLAKELALALKKVREADRRALLRR
jgi:hypothetical protein